MHVIKENAWIDEVYINSLIIFKKKLIVYFDVQDDIERTMWNQGAENEHQNLLLTWNKPTWHFFLFGSWFFSMRANRPQQDYELYIVNNCSISHSWSTSVSIWILYMYIEIWWMTITIIILIFDKRFKSELLLLSTHFLIASSIQHHQLWFQSKA